MITQLLEIVSDSSTKVRSKLFGIYGVLIAINVLALDLGCPWHSAVTLYCCGTALLAYWFGLRHAVDADHIAAIDNVTRKLMQAGKRPVGVGLMFSLGHSTMWCWPRRRVAATALALKAAWTGIKEVGAVIGTMVSTLFLFAIALMNLVILRSVIRAFRRVRNGEQYKEEDFDMLLANRGLLARIFRPLFRLITKSWHMYLLGFLFGLGFDTATEVGLLGISAAAGGARAPDLVDHGVSGAVHRGHDADRLHRQHSHAGCYGWALREADSQALLQHDHHFVSVVVALW